MRAAAALCALYAAAAAGLGVEVFTQGEAGYYCIKIPVLLQTRKGTLLAFGEARKGSCSDYAATDLVFKRSTDGGLTWSPLGVVWSNSTVGGVANTIGNAAPVQLRETGRILIPFSRNNSDLFTTHSDDDGRTWAEPRPIVGGADPSWVWVGLGPPGSIQLRSGRILVPCYHSSRPNDNGEFSHGHTMLSDDGGETWRIGARQFGEARHHSNECQAVELANGSVLINARGLLFHRLQTVSHDGGETFGPVRVVPELLEPVSGCEGSIARDTASNALLYTGTMGTKFTGLFRENMTLWRSDDDGANWRLRRVVDTLATAYSSVVVLQNGSAGLLYEMRHDRQLVFTPEKFYYTALDF